MDEELIAPCGINCGVCRMYLFRNRGLYRSKNAGCTGCIPRGTGCKIKGGCEPLNSKSVRFCFECNDFPCKVINSLEKRYKAKYNTSIIENLDTVRDKGPSFFLEKDAARWSCT